MQGQSPRYLHMYVTEHYSSVQTTYLVATKHILSKRINKCTDPSHPPVHIVLSSNMQSLWSFSNPAATLSLFIPHGEMTGVKEGAGTSILATPNYMHSPECEHSTYMHTK